MSQRLPFRTPSEDDPGPTVVVSPADEPLRSAPIQQHEEIHSRDPNGLERHEHAVQDPAGFVHQERRVENHGAERLITIAKTTQFVWLIVSAIDGLIALRVILKLMAANPSNSFANFIYNFSDVFLGPFYGLTGTPRAGQMVLEISSLIAMAVYALVGWVIVKLVWLFMAPTTARSETTYDRYRT